MITLHFDHDSSNKRKLSKEEEVTINKAANKLIRKITIDTHLLNKKEKNL